MWTEHNERIAGNGKSSDHGLECREKENALDEAFFTDTRQKQNLRRRFGAFKFLQRYLHCRIFAFHELQLFLDSLFEFFFILLLVLFYEKYNASLCNE